MSNHGQNQGSHIRFKDNVSFDPHAVHCVLHEPSCGEVHLGLLQALHTYIVSFDMPHQLGDLAIPPLQTPTVTVMSLRPIEDQCGHHVTLEVKCNEDGFLDEEIVFENKSEQTFTLKIRSKLMGNHMGTPALKSGVKLLHKAFDVSSDAASDWQGFE